MNKEHMDPINLEQIIEGKLYKTETATLIASDAYWDGHNHERHGRNTFLLKTPKGNFFLQHQTMWEGEHDRIFPVSIEDAKEKYESLIEHEVTYEEAFGDRPEEA